LRARLVQAWFDDRDPELFGIRWCVEAWDADGNLVTDDSYNGRDVDFPVNIHDYDRYDWPALKSALARAFPLARIEQIDPPEWDD
jgi:hypothetical protein